MDCKNCGFNRLIVNKHFNLCFKCNNERLSSTKKFPLKKVNLPHKVNKVKLKIDKDEEFYLECFNLSNHLCEECGIQLPTTFKNESGKIIARWRYSHILPKSIFSELRHNITNINHLCLTHHFQWDHGDKTIMNIYQSNRKKFPNYLK